MEYHVKARIASKTIDKQVFGILKYTPLPLTAHFDIFVNFGKLRHNN
jgi:hypothetical protein